MTIATVSKVVKLALLCNGLFSANAARNNETPTLLAPPESCLKGTPRSARRVWIWGNPALTAQNRAPDRRDTSRFGRSNGVQAKGFCRTPVLGRVGIVRRGLERGLSWETATGTH